MADDFVVVECEKCSTKFKIRAIALKITKDVKCPKCANRILVSTIKKQSQSAAAPAAEATSPAPAVPTPEAPVSAVPPPAEAKADVPAQVPPVPVPEAPPPAAPIPPPPAPVDTVNPALQKELDEAKARLRELEAKLEKQSGVESELAAALQKIQEIESRPPPPPPPAPAGSAADAEELVKARQVIAEQEERLTELQRLWYEKEKEARSGYDVASRASKEFDYVTTQFRSLMRSFHEAAIHSAETRLNELEGRIEMLIKEAKAKNGPPP